VTWAARRLFLAKGYTATTVDVVAASVRVSAETVYATFGGKRGLLEAVIEAAVLDEEANRDKPDWAADIERLESSRERLRAWAAHTCGHLQHTSPIHALIRGAADSDSFAADLRRRLLAERLAAQTERARQFLAGRLRPGLSVEEAGERYCALLSPELFHVLTTEMGWSPDRHRTWITGLLEVELLPPGG